MREREGKAEGEVEGEGRVGEVGESGLPQPSAPERAFKGVFPSNINASQSGPAGTDFTWVRAVKGKET